MAVGQGPVQGMASAGDESNQLLQVVGQRAKLHSAGIA